MLACGRALRWKRALKESPQKRIEGVHSFRTKGQPKLLAWQALGDKDKILHAENNS